MFRPIRILAVLFLVVCTSFGQRGEFRFTVLDEKGAAFPGLKLNDVSFTVDGQVVTPAELRMDTGPLSLLIMIDASLSQENVLPFEKKAAAEFIDTVLLQGKDRVGLASFNTSPTVVHDVTTDLERVKASLGKIRIVPPSGYIGGGVLVAGPPPNADAMKVVGTSMFDALERLIGDFSYSGWSGERKAILLISDGYVTAGEKKLKDVVRASARAMVPVYVIGIGDDFFDGVNKSALNKIAAETGGVATFPGTESKIVEILPKLANPLRSQYVVVLPIDGGKGKKISVEITAPTLKSKLRVIAPRSF